LPEPQEQKRKKEKGREGERKHLHIHTHRCTHTGMLFNLSKEVNLAICDNMVFQRGKKITSLGV
jgi:hypothetical protein